MAVVKIQHNLKWDLHFNIDSFIIKLYIISLFHELTPQVNSGSWGGNPFIPNPPWGGVRYLNTSCARQNQRHRVFLVSASFIHRCPSKNDPTDGTNCSDAFLLTCMHGWCPSSSIKQKFEIYICSIITNLYSSLNTLWVTYYHNNNWRDLKFCCINFFFFFSLTHYEK